MSEAKSGMSYLDGPIPAHRVGELTASGLLSRKANRIASVQRSREAASSKQFERAPAVGPGAVAEMAKRGECGIGEREHA